MKKSLIFLLLLIAISVLAVFMPATPAINAATYNSGDIAWMLTASALVLLMTPGLAFFYGGMIDLKNVINTMFQSFIAMGVVGVVWIVVGFSLAFGDTVGGLIGNPGTFFMFQNVVDHEPWKLATSIPLCVVRILPVEIRHHHPGIDHCEPSLNVFASSHTSFSLFSSQSSSTLLLLTGHGILMASCSRRVSLISPEELWYTCQQVSLPLPHQSISEIRTK